ncbi:TPA: hypothetical protein ACX6QB_001924 [Photobacterium damselae]
MSYISLREFGYNFLGPLGCFLSQEIYQNVSNNEKVFFLAREGYFLNNFFSKWLENKGRYLEHDYLTVSRSFLFKIGLINKKTLDISLNCSFSGTVKSLFENRFSLSQDEIHKIFKMDQNKNICLPKDIEYVKKIIYKNEIDIKKIIKPKYDLYSKYLDDKGFFKEEISVVDIGYNGTIQKLLSLLYSKNINGHYLITHKDEKNDIGGLRTNITGYLKTDVKFGDGYVPLDRSIIIESLLTAPVGQLVDIDTDGFKYGRKVTVQSSRQDLDVIFDGGYMLAEEKNRSEYTKKDLETILNSYLINLNIIPKQAMHLFDIDDDISGFGTINALKMWGVL